MIMNNMFRGCSSFTEITISSPLTTIGSDAFVSCISLRNVWFQTPSSLTTIQHYAFYGCPLKQVYIPISIFFIIYFYIYYATSPVVNH